MNKALEVFALCALSAAVASALADAPKTKASRTFPPELRDISRQLRLLLGEIKICNETLCEVEVKITRGLVDGQDTCVAKVPEKIWLKSQVRTRIVWRLVPDTIANVTYGDATYEFQQDNGILILKDDNFQLDTRQTFHGWGDGVSTTPARSRYFFWHLNSKRQKQAVYFPIVLQKKKDVDDSLCAATDPRIVND
jgi:hypothetical protein